MSGEQKKGARNRRAAMLQSHIGFKLESLFDRILAARDSYTREHSLRVVTLAEEIGSRLALEQRQMDVLSLAAAFHDIGKIGIPDRILLKSGNLSSQEYEIIKEHSTIGANMLRSLGHALLDEVADCVLYHHERWDGSGYPDGLAGESIPLLSRIVSVVDAFDAMTTRRSYRQPLAKPSVLQIINELAGDQFCPDAADALLAVVPGE